MEAIKFENFSCYYKHKKDFIKALDGVNLSVHNGELLVVVGESGSGKSTLLKCVLGQCSYVDGQLFVYGQPIEQLNVRTKNFAYVHQNITLYPHITVYENIAFPLRVMGTSQKETDARVSEVASKMGIDWLLTRKPRQLSVGQCQRVALARAVIKHPQLILFDEPFANIDPLKSGELRQLVRQIHKDYNPTILFVTHNLQEAFALGDRIVVLEQGKVSEAGTPKQLLQNPQSELLKGYINETNSADETNDIG